MWLAGALALAGCNVSAPVTGPQTSARPLDFELAFHLAFHLCLDGAPRLVDQPIDLQGQLLQVLLDGVIRAAG